MLAQSILSLTITPEFVGANAAIASISRMKAKVLSIVSLLKLCIVFLYLLSATHTKFIFMQLQHLFESESVSFLDEVANAGNLHLAKAIALKVSPYKWLCSKIDRTYSFLI